MTLVKHDNMTRGHCHHLHSGDPVCPHTHVSMLSWFWQKGAGYHLDLFWVAILMIVCSFMGLPWYVAATVISIAHIDSLKMETEPSAPGEQPKFLGVRWVPLRRFRFLHRGEAVYGCLSKGSRHTLLYPGE